MSLDLDALYKRLKGKKARLVRLAGVFREYYRPQLEAIGAALERADATALRESAHTYKGTVGSFEAREATALALDLEMRGREVRLEGAAEVYAQLLHESERLRTRLEEVLADPSWAD